MKRITALLSLAFVMNASAQSGKLQQDREAIKSMVGCYNVTFNFAETFAPDTAYRIHHPHSSGGLELVSLIEETENRIVLQHLLIVSDSAIIKHWREDWIYENTELFQYQKDNTWKKVRYSPKEVKGQWTQKVYQVDDSPRYEGTATWVHVDGQHSWESVSDAPLPRREFTTRSDYNVLKRRNRVYLTDYGWMFEQDNRKIVRNGDRDSLIVWEKGFEKFERVDDARCLAASNWWKINKDYWADVRAVWSKVFAERNTLAITKKIDNKVMWEKLFALGEEVSKAGNKNQKANRVKIEEVITQYMNRDRNTGSAN